MSVRRLIALISAAAVFAGWYYGIYEPTRQQLETVDRKILDAETQLRDYQSTVAQVPLLLRASSDLGARKRRQNSVLFAKQDILKMFDQVAEEARNERMSVVEIAPPLSELLTLNAARKNPDEALFLNMTVRVMGDYVGFGRFAERVERLPYFRGVTNLLILGTADKSAPLVYSIGFKAMLRNGEGPA
jgi:hypothetical protein